MLTTGEIVSKSIWHLKRTDNLEGNSNLFFNMGYTLISGENNEYQEDAVYSRISTFINKLHKDQIITEGKELLIDDEFDSTDELYDECRNELIKSISEDIWAEAESYYKEREDQ